MRGTRVVLRALEPGDAATLRAIRATPEVAARWLPPPEDFPFGDEPQAERLAIVLDGEVVGLVQYTEEPDPDQRHADIDVFVDRRVHWQGLGTDAIATVSRHLLERRGHHRLTLYTAVDNAAAIRCYEKAGFRRVGVLEAAARDPRTGRWEDELLLERVDRSHTIDPY